MKTIEARFTLYAIGLFISSIIERFITVNIVDRAENPFYFHFLSVIILLFIFMLTTFGIKWFVGTRCITKLIHRKNYIGGRWVEIVVDNKGAFHHYNILDIDHGAYNISLVGTTFDKQLNYKYKFASLHATFEAGDILSYTYIQRDFADTAHLEMGMLQFFSHFTKQIPMEYFGNYRNATCIKEENGITTNEQEVFRLRGFKLEEEEVKRLKDANFDMLHDDINETLEKMDANVKQKIAKRRINSRTKIGKEELEKIMCKYRNFVCDDN